MDPSLSTVLLALTPGAAAFIFSVASFVFVQWWAKRADERATRVEERAAAKDTVNALAVLNEALSHQLSDVQGRLTVVERQLVECENSRSELLLELLKKSDG